MKEQADAFIKSAETDGVEVNGVTMTVEQLTQQELQSTDKKVQLEDGKMYTYQEAIEIYQDSCN